MGVVGQLFTFTKPQANGAGGETPQQKDADQAMKNLEEQGDDDEDDEVKLSYVKIRVADKEEERTDYFANFL